MEVDTAVVEMVKGTEVVIPPATVTVAGTEATVGSELDKLTVVPPAGAPEVSATVFAVVELPPTTDVGARVTPCKATLVSEKVVE